MTQTVIRQLKAHMALQGLNQKKLASRVGISEQRLSSLFTGKAGKINQSYLDMFKILDVELTLTKSKGND